MTDIIEITGFDLTIKQIVQVARSGYKVSLPQQAVSRMHESRKVIDHAISRGLRVYGLTTSVAAKTGIALDPQRVGEFNRRLLATHNIGHGPVVPHETVRAMMLILLNGMASGRLGVRALLADILVEALNSNRSVKVHAWGSMGESDMSPISDLVLDLYADVEMLAGEALALLNSSSLSTGTAALAIHDLNSLLDFSALVSALSMEGFAANPSTLSDIALASRPFKGLQFYGSLLRNCLQGSYLFVEGGPRNLQDPLCFRSLPLLLGTASDALSYSTEQIQTELNASQNNPVVSIEHDTLVSVANFDMLSLSMALDIARLAFVPLMTSSAERLAKMVDSFWSGLTTGLIEEDGVGAPGFNGLAQFHKSITAEARLLAGPITGELPSSSHSNGNLDRASVWPD